MSEDDLSTRQSFLSTATPGPTARRVAWALVATSFVSLAVIAPWARTPLPPLAAFIPCYEASLLLISLLTAFLLLSQYAIVQRRSLLVIAAAFFFDACMIAAHLASFPGAFAPRGLFGDAQTTAWLYVFWHAAFPLFVGGYARLADSRVDRYRDGAGLRPSIVSAFLGVFATAALLVWISATQTASLPTLVAGRGNYGGLVSSGISPAMLGLCLVAIAMMWRRRRSSVLDLWLFAALWVSLCDIALSAVVGSSRFDLGWYAGRSYGLLGGSFVLVALLVELDKLYSRLADVVAQLHRRNEELVRSRGELARAQRLEALGQLTGGMAHDFNNVLAAVTGNLEMIARRPEDTGRVVRLAGNASKAAERGARLIRRLLTFARRQNLRPEVVDCNAMLAELWADPAPSDAAIRFEPGEAGHVSVDVAEFQAALLNLVGNARDAMGGGGEVVIRTRIVTLAADATGHARDQAHVEIAVGDHGTGMSAEVQARIFEPFFTTKALGLGTGLGLSQVYGFMQSAGGTIAVESVEGRGSIFRLQLPRVAPNVAAPAAPPAIPSAPAPTRAGATVLLVEDDADVLVTTCERLEELGYRVVSATCADDALARLDDGPEIDLVISDIVMPGALNGVQLAEEIARRRPALRTILTSGYTGTALKAFNLPGDVLFLPKPFARQALVDVLAVAHAD